MRTNFASLLLHHANAKPTASILSDELASKEEFDVSQSPFTEQSPDATVASVVFPSLRCRHCGCLFDTVSSYRTHYREHKAGAIPTQTTSLTNEDVEENGSEESDENGEEKEETIAEADRDGEDVDVAEKSTGPLVQVLITDPSSKLKQSPQQQSQQQRHGWVFRTLLITSGDVELAAAASDRSGTRRTAFPISLHTLSAPGETWAVLLLQSGYFSASVWQIAASTSASSVSRSTDELGGQSNDESYPRAVLHKRFNHYTTRRKQGGSQSAHDASRGTTAKSAGANLRRAGELHLQQDITGLLNDSHWATLLRGCRRIFIAAPRAMTTQLFEGNKTLQRRDPRIARIPFMTGRPSLLEAQRVVDTLTTFEEESLDKPTAAPKQAVGKRQQRTIIVATSDMAKEDTDRKNAMEHVAAAAEHQAVVSESVLSSVANTSINTDEPEASRVVNRFVAVADDDESDDTDTTEESSHHGENGAGEESTLAEVAQNQHQKPQRSRQQRRRRVPPTAPTVSSAATSVEVSQPQDALAPVKEEADEDVELIRAAIADVNNEAKQALVVKRQHEQLIAEQLTLVKEAEALAGPLRVPPALLLAYLRLSDFSSSTVAVSRSVPQRHSGRNSRQQSHKQKASHKGTTAATTRATEDTNASLKQRLGDARDRLNTMKMLRSMGTKPHELFSAMGWDTLAAAALVASTGMAVDWAAAAPPLEDGNARNSDDDGDGAAISILPPVSSAGRRGKGGKKAVSRNTTHRSIENAQDTHALTETNGIEMISQAAPLTTAATSITAAAIPSQQPAATPSQQPASPVNTAEQRRAILREAAERRAAVSATPAIEPAPTPAPGETSTPPSTANTLLRLAVAAASTWVPGMRN